MDAKDVLQTMRTIEDALQVNETVRMLVDYFQFYGVTVTVKRPDLTVRILHLSKGNATLSWMIHACEILHLRSKDTLHVLAREYIDQLDRMNTPMEKNAYPLVETLDVQRVHMIDMCPFYIELGTQTTPTQFIIEATPSHKSIATHGLSYTLKKGDSRVYQYPYFIRHYTRNDQLTTHLLISAFNDARYLCIKNDAKQEPVMDTFIALLKQAEYHETIEDTSNEG